MRVVHVGPATAGSDGVAHSIEALLDSPLAACYRMEAIGTWHADAGPVRRVFVFAAALIRLLRACAASGEQIVHVHTAVRGSWYRKAVCVALAKLMRRPVVLQIHVGPGDIADFDSRLGPVRRAAFTRLFSLPDRVLSVSRAGAQEVERRFGRSGIVVIPNPAPSPAQDGPATLAGEPTLLYLGGFADPAKGGKALVEALPKIVERQPGVRVILAGPGHPPGHEQRAIDALPGVRWCGWLDPAAKARAFAHADVVALPSVSEGMPHTLLEAMAAGRAVVATSVGGIPDVLTDGEDGLVVRAGAVGALAEGVCRLLGDPELRKRLGDAAQRRVERLTRDEVWGRLDSVYRELALPGSVGRV